MSNLEIMGDKLCRSCLNHLVYCGELFKSKAIPCMQEVMAQLCFQTCLNMHVKISLAIFVVFLAPKSMIFCCVLGSEC